MSNSRMLLITTFKRCLDILRDNEAITGDKALRNLSYLLILKMLEPTISNSDFLQYKFDFGERSVDQQIKILNAVKFTELSKIKEIDLENNLKCVWELVLAKHPTTKKLFITEKFFEIKKNYTFYELIKILNKLDLSKIDYDVLGNVYEEVISEVMTGKTLGQFFTQPVVKKIMIDLINPQILENGNIESVCDPTMGTGGFLISYINDIKNKAKQQNINLNWENIKSNIFGQEIEPDTYQLAASNMLISSGRMFDHLKCGDSIRDPIFQKFDNILANPPFGIKGLKYDDIIEKRKNISVEQYNQYIPIKANNAVSLFIQAIIYMLKVNGKCAVVIPDGQDLFSKTNKTLILIREYLLKTCDLQEIIYLPSGIFTYTSIKTCIFYFVKKVEGHDILEIQSKYSKIKPGIETSRKYIFDDEHQTKNIKFYEYNTENNTKTLLVDVSIEQLKNNKYSFNYNEYIEKVNNINYSNDIQIMTLKELCVFLPKSKRKASYGNVGGKYPFYTSSMVCKKYCDEYDYNIESLIMGDGGGPNINYDTKFSVSDHCYVLQKNNKNVHIKYIYYYILTNLNMLDKLYTGVAIKNISKTNIENIQIPVPPLEQQINYIRYCDNNKKEIENNQKEIENNIHITSEFLNKML